MVRPVKKRMSKSSLPAYTAQEVASHNTTESLWVSIEGKVYDLTVFQETVSSIKLYLQCVCMCVFNYYSTLEVQKCFLTMQVHFVGVSLFCTWHINKVFATPLDLLAIPYG